MRSTGGEGEARISTEITTSWASLPVKRIHTEWKYNPTTERTTLFPGFHSISFTVIEPCIASQDVYCVSDYSLLVKKTLTHIHIHTFLSYPVRAVRAAVAMAALQKEALSMICTILPKQYPVEQLCYISTYIYRFVLLS